MIHAHFLYYDIRGGLFEKGNFFNRVYKFVIWLYDGFKGKEIKWLKQSIT